MELRIRTKIFISFGSVAAVLLMLVGVIFYGKATLYHQFNYFKEEMEMVRTLSGIRLAMDRVILPPKHYLLTGDIKEREKFQTLIKDVEEDFKGIDMPLNSHHISSHKELIDLYKDALERVKDLKKTSEEMFAIPDPVGNKKAVMLMRRIDNLSTDIITNYLDRLIEFEHGDMKRITAAAADTRKVVDIFTFAGVAAALTLFFFFALYLFRSIVGPILEFQKGAKKLGEDLDYRIDIRDGVEINVLAREFNMMGDRLKDLYTGLERKVEERTMELKKMNAVLKELSITDGLTGLYNHKFFHDKLNEEIRRTERYGRPLSLIMIDVDHFKEFNDTNGHPEGDRLLKFLAATLKENVRGEDIAARYGGEEFAIILPETGKDAALVLAERLRKAVAKRDFPGGDTQPGGGLTISLGVAAFTKDADNADALTKAADDALYRAKAKGRNRVEAAAGDAKKGSSAES